MLQNSPAGRVVSNLIVPANSAFWTFFGDLAVRNGIKFALAGTLALFFSLLIRLDEPAWAVTTAFVLSTPKFVGAIGEKTVLRIFGAMAGALIGYLITGSLQQNPVLFLGAMGSLVAFGTAMYGGPFIPYGFRQCAYTATLVAAQGLANPGFSWHVGLARCEEICMGIVVTMVVTTTIWPRYARKEFGDGVRDTLQILGDLFRQRAAAFLSGNAVPPQDVLATVGGRLAKLRKMIRLGCMESTGFRARRPEVDAVVSQLGILSTSLSNFGRTLPSESLFRDYIETEAVALHTALASTIGSLADPRSTEAFHRACLEHAGVCLQRYEARLQEFRLDGVGENLTMDESLEHAGYSLSIHEIYGALAELSALLPGIEAGQIESFPWIRFEKFALPDAGWIKSGIRAGLAVVIGLFLLDWLKPPGGDILVVGAYLFTGFSLESSDRKGDLGVFNTLVWTILACTVYFFILLAMAPMMSSYAVLNICLGTLFFLTGYLLEKGAIGSFVTLVALLMSVILVGLNAQRPVGFQSVADPILGLMLAATLSAFMRRLIWPVLPQNALRARLTGLLSLLEKTALHPESAVPIPDRANIALSAADAIVLVGVLEGKTLSSEESERLRSYIRCLARLGGHLMFSTGSVDFPPRASLLYRKHRARLLHDIARRLNGQRAAIEQEIGIPFAGPLPNPRRWITLCRRLIRKAKPEVPKTVAAIARLYRHEQAVLATDEAGLLASSLCYSEDFSDSTL